MQDDKYARGEFEAQNQWKEATETRLRLLEQGQVKMDVLLERIGRDIAEIKKDFRYFRQQPEKAKLDNFWQKAILDLLKVLGLAIGILAGVLGFSQLLP